MELAESQPLSRLALREATTTLEKEAQGLGALCELGNSLGANPTCLILGLQGQWPEKPLGVTPGPPYPA